MIVEAVDLDPGAEFQRQFTDDPSALERDILGLDLETIQGTVGRPGKKEYEETLPQGAVKNDGYSIVDQSQSNGPMIIKYPAVYPLKDNQNAYKAEIKDQIDQFTLQDLQKD